MGMDLNKFENIISHLDAIEANVSIGRADYRAFSGVWKCDIEKNNGEVKIEISIVGNSFQEVLERAYNKFIQTANAGVDFAGVIEPPKPTPDEEIPF